MLKRLPVLIALIGCVACGTSGTAAGPPPVASPPLLPSATAGAAAAPFASATDSRQQNPPPAASPAPDHPPPQERPIGGPRHLLIGVAGEARLRQSNWTTDVRVGFGTLLADADQLEVRGQAQVLCADLQLAQVPPERMLTLGRDLCPPVQAARISLPLGLAQTLRKPNTALPYVISPRASSIREAQPLLRWNDTGHPPYTLTLSAADQVWSQAGLQENRVRYPGTPPLQAGVAYIVTVQDSAGRSSNEEGAPGLGFELIDAQAASQVAADLALIDRAGLPEPAAAYARAWLLASQNLMAEALEQLQSQPAPSAAALLASADVAYRIRLVLPARAAYEAAAAQARADDDRPMLAAALAGLGNTLSDQAAARAALLEARELFLSFGDSARVEELDAYIELSQP